MYWKKLKTFAKGGIHPKDNKISATSPIVPFPIPETVVISLSQHIGAPAKAVVEIGQAVMVGTLLGESGGFISARVHSSVSGIVQKIENRIDTSGFSRVSVIIKTQHDVWENSVDISEELVTEITDSAQQIKQKIESAGIVGMGGATFPLHVKLNPPSPYKAEVLIINAVECEPYLTADHRLMLEKSHQILVGIQILKKALGVSKAIVGIENNKKDAIELLRLHAKQYAGIEIVALQVKYPQGGEKQLIKALINKEIPSGKLPIAVGAVVVNLATAFASYEAVQKNKPLIERVVTVTGDELAKNVNYRVRIGTLIDEILAYNGGLPEQTKKVISGGPMMGKALATLNVPVSKGTSGILVVSQSKAERKESQNCIRCARCVSVCPMGLEPYILQVFSENKMNDNMELHSIMDCIECGSCSYICPANRPLLDYIRLGKSEVGKVIKSRNLK